MKTAKTTKKTTATKKSAKPAAGKTEQSRKAALAEIKSRLAGKTPAKSAAKVEPKPRKRSALDAAAIVLREAGKPMRTIDMITKMEERNLWKSPGGKTPAATLYAAIIREIGSMGTGARFAKQDRGLFVTKGSA